MTRTDDREVVLVFDLLAHHIQKIVSQIAHFKFNIQSSNSENSEAL